MSETGDMWREVKKIRSSAKAQRREQGPLVLREHNVFFTTHNNGAHLRIEGLKGEMIDFWPGTGAWKSSVPHTGGRGLKELLGYLGFTDEAS